MKDNASSTRKTFHFPRDIAIFAQIFHVSKLIEIFLKLKYLKGKSWYWVKTSSVVYMSFKLLIRFFKLLILGCSALSSKVFFRSNPLFPLKCLTSLWSTILELNAACYDDFILCSFGWNVMIKNVYDVAMKCYDGEGESFMDYTCTMYLS